MMRVHGPRPGSARLLRLPRPHRPAAAHRPVRRAVPGLRRGRARRHLRARREHGASPAGGHSINAAFRRRHHGARHRVQPAGRYDDQVPRSLGGASLPSLPTAGRPRWPRRSARPTSGSCWSAPPSPWRSSRWSPLALGWLVAGRVLRPLSTITAAARRISATSLHERLALHGPDDELKELGDTLDEPVRAAGGLLRRPAALRRQRLTRAAHPADQGAHPASGHPRRPRPPPPPPGRPSAGNCWPPTPSRNASSRRCSPWPAAKPAPASASPSTWPPSPAPPWPPPAPRSAGWACTSRPTSSPPSSTATRSWSSSWWPT